MTQPPFTSFGSFTGVVERSATYGRRQFPTRTDYERAFAAVNPRDRDPWGQSAFAVAAMRHWHTRGQTGCLFARRLAAIATETQWASSVYTSASQRGLAKEMAKTLNPALGQAISAPECEILSLIFTRIVTVGGLKTVCRLLTETSPITMSELPSQADTVVTALRLDISGAGTLSWLMAFGPFDSWPPTRRGPVLEIAIRVKPKPRNLFHKLSQDPSAAHLADIDPSLTEAQMEKVFDRTEKFTREILGGDPDHRSAAKASFSFPAAEWTEPENSLETSNPGSW
jgi:hypothetical protein